MGVMAYSLRRFGATENGVLSLQNGDAARAAGGEVERALTMVDGDLLLVDSSEGVEDSGLIHRARHIVLRIVILNA